MRSRDSVAAAMVLVTVGLSIFAIGGSTRPTALLGAALGLACAIPYLNSRRGFAQTPALIALIGVAFGVTLLQVIPLPHGLVSILSPQKAELVRANAAALGDSAPSFTPLSLEPSATWLGAALLAGYIGCAVAAVRVGATSRGRTILARGLVAIAASVALVAVVHEIAGAATLFGIYTPETLRGTPSFLAPLMNPNHLAGVLAIAAPIAIALAFSAIGGRRLLWGGCATLCAVVTLALKSRTASIALIVGITVVATLLVRQTGERRRSAANRANRVAAAIAFAVVIVAALTYFGHGALKELADTEATELAGEHGKIAVWRSSLPLLWDHKVLGVGRGAFEQALTPAYHPSRFKYSHVENEYLQAALDWGIPAALLMLALGLVAFRTAMKRALRSPLEAGLAAAIVTAGVHHLADFAIGLPGPALFVIVAFAALSREELGKAQKVRRMSPRTWRAVALASAIAILALAASPVASGPRADSADLATHYGKADETARAVEVWRKHPADYIAAGQVADSLRRNSDDRAFRVASRALAINPTHWQLHLTVARMLLQTPRPEQALGEYRLAIQHAELGVVGAIVRELVSRFPEPQRAVRGLPSSERRFGVIAVSLRQISAHAIGRDYFRLMATEFPRNARAADELARFSFNRRDWAAAADAARQAVELGRRQAASLAARSMVRAGDAQGAVSFLTALRSDTSKRRPKKAVAIRELGVLAKAHQSMDQHQEAIAAMGRLLDLVGRGRPEAKPHFLYLAEIQEKIGHVHQAAENRAAAQRLGGRQLNGGAGSGN